MSVFDKARELSAMILETNEYKNLDKFKIAKARGEDVEQELIDAKKEFNSFMEQIFLLIKLNIFDEYELEDNKIKCGNCNGCNKSM